MKFSISRENLLKPLQLVAGVVERRQTLPILSNVLLKAGQEGLSIIATDLEIEMLARTSFDCPDEGSVTLPARKFIDICRALPEQAIIEISTGGSPEKSGEESGGRAVMRSGKSRFVLLTLPAAEFPNIGSFESLLQLSISQIALKTLINSTSFAMAQQDIRYYLNGLLLEVTNGRMRAVATDGHRLALNDASAEVKVSEALQIILPRKAVNELSRLLDDSDNLVEVQIGSNHIRLITPTLSFTSKLIDGRFPDYHRVVPQNGDKIVTSDRETLKQALVRTSILSNEKHRSVRLMLTKGSLRLFAHNPEQEQAEEEVAVDYNGFDIEIGFNVNYMVDALSAITTPHIRLILTDSNSCCLIQGVGKEDCKYVVMPMRL